MRFQLERYGIIQNTEDYGEGLDPEEYKETIYIPIERMIFSSTWFYCHRDAIFSTKIEAQLYINELKRARKEIRKRSR